MATTRGDRLFIGLLGAAYINLACRSASATMIAVVRARAVPSVWIGFVGRCVLGLIMRKAARQAPADLPSRRRHRRQREAIRGDEREDGD